MKTEELEEVRDAIYSTSVEAVIAPDSAILMLWRSLAAALSFGVGGAESVVVVENGVDAPECTREAMVNGAGWPENAGRGGEGIVCGPPWAEIIFIILD